MRVTAARLGADAPLIGAAEIRSRTFARRSGRLAAAAKPRRPIRERMRRSVGGRPMQPTNADPVVTRRARECDRRECRIDR